MLGSLTTLRVPVRVPPRPPRKGRLKEEPSMPHREGERPKSRRAPLL